MICRIENTFKTVKTSVKTAVTHTLDGDVKANVILAVTLFALL